MQWVKDPALSCTGLGPWGGVGSMPGSGTFTCRGHSQNNPKTPSISSSPNNHPKHFIRERKQLLFLLSAGRCSAVFQCFKFINKLSVIKSYFTQESSIFISNVHLSSLVRKRENTKQLLVTIASNPGGWRGSAFRLYQVGSNSKRGCHLRAFTERGAEGGWEEESPEGNFERDI